MINIHVLLVNQDIVDLIIINIMVDFGVLDQ